VTILLSDYDVLSNSCSGAVQTSIHSRAGTNHPKLRNFSGDKRASSQGPLVVKERVISERAR